MTLSLFDLCPDCGFFALSLPNWSSTTGTRTTMHFDSAAAVEENKTLGEGATSGQRGFENSQGKHPQEMEPKTQRRRPRGTAGIAELRGARDCLRCKKPRLRIGATSIEVQGPLEVDQNERLNDALGLES